MVEIQQLTAAEAYHLCHTGQAQLMDVREISEYTAYHITNTPLNPLSNPYWTTLGPQHITDLTATTQGQMLILVCRSGGRSQLAAERLRQAGYSGPLAHLVGGIMAWHQENLPLESGAYVPPPAPSAA